MADKSTTVISLPQMVDLALNSPEVGIVNFTVLHSLLHVIVNQLDLGDCNVEFRGSDSERLQNYIATAKPGPIITLTEYTVGPDGKNRKKRRGSKKNGKRTSADEKGKKDENQKEKEIAIIKKEEDGSNEAESSGSFQTIVVVEPASKEKIGDSPKFTIALTKEQLSKLQRDIKDLQKQVKELTELPGNMGLIDALRSSKDGSNSPLLDMFQILTLVKRLDATEEAMNKVASMLEDLAKEQSNLIASGGQRTSVSFKDQSRQLLSKSQELRRSLDATVGGSNQIQELVTIIKELETRVSELEKIANNIGTSSNTSSNVRKPAKRSSKTDADVSEHTMPEGDNDFNSTDLSLLSPKEAIERLQREIINMKEFHMSNDAGLEALKEILELKETLTSGGNKDNLPPDVKFGQMELKINTLKDQITTLDTVYHQQFSNIADRMDHLEKEISALWERINLGMPAGDGSSGANSQNVQELYNQIMQLQEEMSTLAENTNKLLVEREGKQSTLDVMLEQIELLKTVKADREDLEDALADKADACQINRKVSHEQFDAAYDEMTKALEDTLDKLKKQEELWIQSLNDLQKEIGNKLDKMELTPLKDFINSKLKGIQEKVKKISALKQEHEAAGTKSKFLRYTVCPKLVMDVWGSRKLPEMEKRLNGEIMNVNCISCDADVIMRKTTDITLFPKPYAMPAVKSPAPYLAYELDLLRKQQKSLPNSKNLNMFESAMNTGKAKSLDPDHLCNRYCGGSHTVTTPQQRVLRVGHFMEQWGPEISPVNEVLIKGTDGHLYKGRDDTMLRALANEKAPTPRVDNPAMVITEYNLNKDQKLDVKTEATQNNGVVVKAEPKESQDSVSKRPKTSADKVPELQAGKPSDSSKRLSTKSAEV